MKIKIFSILFLLLLISCSKENQIKSVKFWKFGDGSHFGDVLDFKDDTYSVKSDTIYYQNKPIYKILKLRQFPSTSLTIKDLETNTEGNYYGK